MGKSNLNIIGIISNTLETTAATSNYLNENSFTGLEVSEKTVEMLAKIKKHGFPMQEFYCFDGLCIAKSKHSFVLHPEGQIYKCLSMVGRSDCMVGDVSTHGVDSIIASEFNEYLYMQCAEESCPFLPLCHTGCRFDALISSGNNAHACKREAYEFVNSFLMKALITD